MKLVTAACALAVLSACVTQAPNVKLRWNKTMGAYSFLPIYPPREDIHIGEIRAHVKTGGSSTFDSRLMWKASEGPIDSRDVHKGAAVLPGTEVVRLATLETPQVGFLSLISKLFGNKIAYNGSLHIVLKDLTVDEVSDIDAASAFLEHMKTELNGDATSKSVRGFCAAAVTLKQENSLSDMRISMVTRTVRAGSVSYFSGEGLATDPAAAKPGNTGKPAASLKGPGIASSAAAFINEKDTKDLNIVVGVDALTIEPLVINKNLPALCKDVIDAFYPSKADAFIERVTAN